MDFFEALAKRRMVRNYTDEAVDPASLDAIARSVTRAPSAGFSQGQAVIVVTDPVLRRKIADAAGEREYVAQGFDPWISTAPAQLVLCVSEDAYHRRYTEADKVGSDGTEIDWPVPYWWVDAGAALMAVLLGAVAEGLAAGFLGSHALEDIKPMLNIPDEYAVVGIVTVGHPAVDRKSTSLDRGFRDIEEVIHRDRWSSSYPDESV